ncbi:heme anaerobic degradation radical SAM methyltransferase ChuW/HutW [Vibrio aestuarianus]|uniref:heme anaerobic degradation radical SAM methyltransferase ChuW/HutW n=1 Tax=Vibrio aestuarianus TaxID=28171 RepID=UPI00237CEB34|nr:heme anaerobic degradation radical SAM methyltransferase ChuW/HutW [Vibrio aestuarianus]MDE1313835.1 heme anaerobic degradation radical SAM methyltransferase ChuW/HutW [Vibrio aestuarianus]
MLNLNKYNESILGAKTDDPLRFSFSDKQSTHAGGSSVPVAIELQSHIWQTLMTQPVAGPKKRCLYIHVPFCRVRCTFCNFFQNASSRSLVDDYFKALMVELEQKSKLPWAQSGIFHAVYIGGGTPTDLSATQIQRLGEAIRRFYPLARDCEITLEGRINRFSDEMFDNALEGGFNRFSFGIQSFNTTVRRSAKRLDDRDVVLERIASLSHAEQAPIVIDLLYGLPYQTFDVFEQDLKDVISTGAHGIDLYQLIVAGSAPMLNLVEKGRIPPPATTPDKASMYELGVNFFDKHHFKSLSVNHWAKDNRERSQYNSLAKTFAEVLPVGCGAGGNIGGYSVMQQRSLKAYMDAMNQNKLPIAMMMKQHSLEPTFAAIKSGFDRGVLARSTLPDFMGMNCFDYLQPLFKHWQRLGLVKLEDEYLVSTLAGAFWAVNLAQACIKVLHNEFNEHLDSKQIANWK